MGLVKKADKITSLKQLQKIKQDVIEQNLLTEHGPRFKITVHLGTCGIASGAEQVKKEVLKNIEDRKHKDIIFSTSGCVGFCALEPMLTVESYFGKPVTYYQLDAEKIEQIFKIHLGQNKIVEELEPITEGSEVNDFYRYQYSRVLRNRGQIDPLNIHHYIARDGYFALAKALSQGDGTQIIEAVTKSGLRGRGGAGFPTGVKWNLCRQAESADGVKYIVCNGDEGDPGAFMDRNLLESDPHSILEGMLIAGLAIGSPKGYIYVRAEYPLAVQTLTAAISQAKQYGLIGKGIMNSDFDFDIQIYEGAGAFVCGEETALLKSIEGKRGMPRPKPPFPSDEGLYGKPTCINNVETLANVSQIILNGPQWFNSLGTETSKGTKIFALAGAVKNVGLVEVPMGMTLRDIVYKIGGGIVGDKAFKAVQMGGPSGGCIPEKFLDIPVDYEKVKQAGSIMGSGGMIVIDEDTCMANLARYFMDFIQDESCGQCVPCRIGTRRMLEILERITKGKGEEEDLEKLEKLGQVIKETSLCGLGKTAPNPVLSSLKYFRNEFEEHISTRKSCERLHIKAKVKKV
ncbi:MAG: NADH-quinone oxidoreductase subunit NuoF [Actinomycetia bacterium]|nr:NADH-quinone oxidoreductase subunit NuoF [Actinomycetes bacterium]